MPFWLGALLFAGGITILNLRGIRYTARANEVMLVFMFGVLICFIFLASKYLIVRHGVGDELADVATTEERLVESALIFGGQGVTA